MKPTLSLPCFVMVFVATLVGQSLMAGEGEARLGVDARPIERRPVGLEDTPANFGFAYMTDVQSTFMDTCKTLPKNDNAGVSLRATDGVASPENMEMIYHQCNGDTVNFMGRTGQCYYMVTGVYVQGQGTGPGSGKPIWHSDFDTNQSQTPHFVVYVNDRYRSDDDQISGDTDVVWVEVEGASRGSVHYFVLSQAPLPKIGRAHV